MMTSRLMRSSRSGSAVFTRDGFFCATLSVVIFTSVLAIVGSVNSIRKRNPLASQQRLNPL